MCVRARGAGSGALWIITTSSLGPHVLRTQIAPSSTLPYLPHVDGLRALAIALVVVFHAWPAALSGGFIGVDVFFVISGFIITRQLIVDMERGEFSYVAFLGRRVRRLVPAAFVCSLLVSAAAIALLMPDDLLTGNSILAYTREAMTPDACEDVEVIGWLYQFYISEKKDEVFDGLKKNKKITPENIPAATQLFTPHWIVRYLVENSLGRLWLLNRPGSKLIQQMDYYIKPEQS